MLLFTLEDFGFLFWAYPTPHKAPASPRIRETGRPGHEGDLSAIPLGQDFLLRPTDRDKHRAAQRDKGKKSNEQMTQVQVSKWNYPCIPPVGWWYGEVTYCIWHWLAGAELGLRRRRK